MQKIDLDCFFMLNKNQICTYFIDLSIIFFFIDVPESMKKNIIKSVFLEYTKNGRTIFVH